jgi:hypothetical protein
MDIPNVVTRLFHGAGLYQIDSVSYFLRATSHSHTRIERFDANDRLRLNRNRSGTVHTGSCKKQMNSRN